MPYWFHGTSAQNVESIKQHGFHKHTYFAKELDDALRLGCAEVIIWIWFDENPTECWEYISDKVIPPDQISVIAKLNPEIIYENEELEIKLSKYHHEKDYPNDIWCEHCKGKGQMESAPFFRKPHKRTVCPICKGFGRLKFDRTVINE